METSLFITTIMVLINVFYYRFTKKYKGMK